MISFAISRLGTNFPWYVVRASGLLGVLFLILLTISGIGQVTGFTFKYFEPLKAWAIHRALAFAACATILIHISFLLIEKVIPFRLVDLVVPFISGYQPFAVGLGVLALYGIILIMATSLGWIEKKPVLWHLTHFLSYLVMIFIFIHALLAGTDFKDGWARIVWMGIGAVLIIFTISRLLRAGSLKKPKK